MITVADTLRSLGRPIGRAGHPQPRRAGRRRRRVAATTAVASIMFAVVLGACSDGPPPGVEAFCEDVIENREALTNPEIATTGDIDRVLRLYRDIGNGAPFAVEEEWNQIVAAYEAASEVDSDDPESEQTALAAALAMEEAATALETWLQRNCGEGIGPVFTIVPPVSAGSVPSTTAP